MIFKNKVKEMEETITPIEVELVDVFLANYYNAPLETTTVTNYYIFKSLKDGKLYISDCNLHASLNAKTDEKDYSLRINKFSTDELFGSSVTNDIVKFGDKGKLYIKNPDKDLEFTSGKWNFYEPSNTRFDGEYIICGMQEKKDLPKHPLTNGTVYRFNDKISFEELKNIEFVTGYTKF